MIPGPETSNDRKYAIWMSGLAAIAVLSLPLMAVYAVLDHSVPARIASFRVLVTLATILIMSTLVFAKLRRLHIDLIATNAVLQHASITDPLTGIRNRRFFSETIEADVARSLRAFAMGQDAAAQDLIFYLIDLDNFKQVNDGFGHHAGDRVLAEATQRINSVVRASDVLVRWGGEEFLIVSRFADRNQGEILALRVMQAMRQEPFVIGNEVSVRQTCSVGWAAFPWNTQDPHALGYEAVLKQADHALGEAKKAGKNRAVGMTCNSGGSAPEMKPCGEVPTESGGLTQAFNVSG
jgi:diguanylate cyclase (GGDEF)-like protein